LGFVKAIDPEKEEQLRSKLLTRTGGGYTREGVSKKGKRELTEDKGRRAEAVTKLHVSSKETV